MNEQSVMPHPPHAKAAAERPPEATSDKAAVPLYRRALDGFYSTCFFLSMAALALMGVAVLLQIGGRLLGFSVPSVPEIAGFTMAASSFLALAHTFREGGHVRVSLVLARLGSKRRLGFERFALSVALLLSLIFAYYLVEMTVESYEFNEASDGVIAIPLWIPQSFVAAGVIALAIAVADVLIESWRGRMPGYVSKEELPH
jgi:TRAP-type C4-dicarboxylate transport system permease small subunit